MEETPVVRVVSVADVVSANAEPGGRWTERVK